VSLSFPTRSASNLVQNGSGNDRVRYATNWDSVINSRPTGVVPSLGVFRHRLLEGEDRILCTSGFELRVFRVSTNRQVTVTGSFDS